MQKCGKTPLQIVRFRTTRKDPNVPRQLVKGQSQVGLRENAKIVLDGRHGPTYFNYG